MSVARHTAYNFLGAVVPIGVTLVTVPLYLQLIGLERYGILALAWAIAGYFAFFDLGIGRAAAQRMASLVDAEPAERSRLFWTSAAITTVLAFTALLAFTPIGVLFLKQLRGDGALLAEARDALPLFALIVVTGVAQSSLIGALEGRRAFAEINIVSVIGNALTAILPLLVALSIGPAIPHLVAATLSARALVLLALAVLCVRRVPVLHPSFLASADARSLLRLGGWGAITGIVGPMLVYFDRFAIGAVEGAAAVAFYVVGYNLIVQMLVVPSSLSRALFPRLAELSVEDSLGRSTDGLRAMAAITTPITVASLLLVRPFLELWVGRNVADQTAPVAIVLMLGFWANSLAQIPFVRLLAMARADLPAKLHIAELVPYGAILWLGLVYFSLVGAAIAWALRCILDFVALLKLAGVPVKGVGFLGAHFALIVGSMIAALSQLESAPLAGALAVLLSVALALSWRVLPAHLMALALAKLRQ